MVPRTFLGCGRRPLCEISGQVLFIRGNSYNSWAVFVFLLSWNFYFFVQEFGGNISSIRSTKGVKIRVDSELLEGPPVLKRIKHFPVKLLTHVYIAFGSVRKKDVNRKVVFIFCSYYLFMHTSSDGTWVQGSDLHAHEQHPSIVS